MQFQVTTTTNCGVFVRMLCKPKLRGRSQKNEQFFLISKYRAYSASTDNILMSIFEVEYNIESRRFTIEYLWVLFRGENVKQ
jgi:hypothetical protein